MSEDQLSGIELDRKRILDAKAKGTGPMLGTFIKMSGPGWLQGAITLGGGSLAGSLYLGVLAGYNLMWLQMVAMILGIVMLSAISYVTLSTGERPFRQINRHLNPVLGWSWVIAVLMANIVWCLPQFALGTAAVTQNLMPGLEGDSGKWITCISLLAIAVAVIWAYDSGAKGIRIFELVLKILVGFIVLSFFGVVIKLAGAGALDWGQIFKGFIPNPGMFSSTTAVLAEHINASSLPDFWNGKVIKDQRDVMITGVATAVGINMTFLLPYSMLKKKWDKDFRTLGIFDLSIGLFVPFILATSCVVIAAASQFHGKFDQELIEKGGGAYQKNLDAFIAAKAVADGVEASAVTPTQKDKELAAMLVKRDAFSLAKALKPLTGDAVANYVFGFGVLAMALSTIIILMLISGFTFCEILDKEPTGWPHRIGCFIAGIGVIGPFVWTGEAKFWLAVPTSTFGMMLLPIAYITFFLMMNSKKILGDDLPQGASKIKWNVLMLIAVAFATYGAAYAIWSKRMLMFGIEVRWIAIGIYLVLLALGVYHHAKRKNAQA